MRDASRMKDVTGVRLRKHLVFLLLFVSCIGGVATAAEGVFDSDGVSIRYVTEGEGEPVVLIHGWMSDSSMWGSDRAGNTKLDVSSAPGFQFIALDCRGHGKSGKPHDPKQYGTAMAADVVRLLDHLKLERAHLVGYSMGAFIAGYVAATHPERVLSVVYGGQAPLVVGRKASASNEVEIFAKAVEDGDLGAYLLAVMPEGRPKPTPEAATALAQALYGQKDMKAFVAAGRSLGKLEVSGERLKKSTAPVLFIHGAGESREVHERVAAVRELLGRGEVRIIAGADHVTTLAKPEFGAALLEFLRANRKK
jgi:pimeloyl-ACP methyl ester carboxylesterase